MEKFPLAVALITKNEEEKITDCLKSIDFAAQIVIVDSGSTDATLEIAEKFGCEIYSENWRGFGAQKQLAIEKCHQPWVLVLDADERLSRETAEKIKSIVTSSNVQEAGFSFPRKNYFQGRWIKHAGWWPDQITRLFKKGAGRMTTAIVHEAVHVDGQVKALHCPIEHLTESRLDRLILKIDKYSTLGAQQAFAEGRQSSEWGAMLRACFTFFHDYFIRLGLFDGPQGLTLAVADAVNKYFKYAKLADLCRKAKTQDRPHET